MKQTDSYLLLEFETYNRYGDVQYEKFHDFFSDDYKDENIFSVHENKLQYWLDTNFGFIQRMERNQYNQIKRFQMDEEYILETADYNRYRVFVRYFED